MSKEHGLSLTLASAMPCKSSLSPFLSRRPTAAPDGISPIIFNGAASSAQGKARHYRLGTGERTECDQLGG